MELQNADLYNPTRAFAHEAPSCSNMKVSHSMAASFLELAVMDHDVEGSHRAEASSSRACQGSEEVDDETAAMVARSLHLVQGPHGPPTTAAQCRFLTADLLTGICLV